MTDENVSDRFDRLPATKKERTVEGRPTRAAVIEWWADRFGIEPAVFDEHTFWEKGNGQCWAVPGDAADPIEIEALGMKVLRARQEHWKPTTNAVQRFGTRASKNVIELSDAEAVAFARGDEQELDWDGDWGYLIAAHEVAGTRTPLGVGLYTYGTLTSMIPTGRQRTLE
jgi:NOL1/NOP2/fmu family ribosome biogenesis protein